MRKTLALPSIFALCLLGGCSSKELATSKAELKACREKQRSMKQEAASCRQELNSQQQRWNNVQESLIAAVPPEVADVQEAIIQNIPQNIPAPVKAELQEDLDKYFVTVAREFQHLQRKNEELLQELRGTGRQVARTQKQVEEVKTVADKIEAGVQAVGQCNEQNEAIQERNRQLSARVERTIATLLTFDREQINCKGCKDRIILLPKGKERILKFHSAVVSDLSSLQASLADGAPPAP